MGLYWPMSRYEYDALGHRWAWQTETNSHQSHEFQFNSIEFTYKMWNWWLASRDSVVCCSTATRNWIESHFRLILDFFSFESLRIRGNQKRFAPIGASPLFPTMQGGYSNGYGGGHIHSRRRSHRSATGGVYRVCSSTLSPPPTTTAPTTTSTNSYANSNHTETETAVASMWEGYDEAYFQSYSNVGIHQEMIKVLTVQFKFSVFFFV